MFTGLKRGTEIPANPSSSGKMAALGFRLVGSASRLASHALAPVGRYMTARERTRKAGVTVQFFAFV
jgi:hypothetical protein